MDNTLKDPMIEFKLDQELLDATKEVALKEEAMLVAQEAYQEAYDNFKLAQQQLWGLQRDFIRRKQDNEESDGSKQVLATESDDV